jgi:hypothetical protein
VIALLVMVGVGIALAMLDDWRDPITGKDWRGRHR